MGVKVLFLSANAGEARRASQRDLPPESGDRQRALSRLDIDREYNGVQEALDFPGLRGTDVIEMIPDVRWDQFCTILKNSHFRFVLHFSGHGDSDGSLYMKNEVGEVIPISCERLVTTIRRHKDRIALVVLNACYTEALATALASDVDVVIGMENAVADRAAISFAKCFYDSLIRCGEPVSAAYQHACDVVEGYRPEDLAHARIKSRPGIDPAKLSLFTPLRDRVPDDVLAQLLKGVIEPLLPPATQQPVSPFERDALIARLGAIDDSIAVVLKGMQYVEKNTHNTTIPSGFRLLEAAVKEAQKNATAIKELLLASKQVLSTTWTMR